MRYIGPKNRIARKFGVNLFGVARNPLVRRSSAPGIHGARHRKKSDFGLQLQEKQKLCSFYGKISKSKLSRYYLDAVNDKGNTQNLFLCYLESRLDTLVHRLRFASTIFHAQQVVSHGHILVNEKRVNIRSFQVSPGMVISVTKKYSKNPILKWLLDRVGDLPSYLELDKEKCMGTLVSIPEIDQVPFPLPMNIAVVCEFLAHRL